MLQELIKQVRERLQFELESGELAERVANSVRRELARKAKLEIMYDLELSHEHANGRIRRHAIDR